jgi:hypothetical protein
VESPFFLFWRYVGTSAVRKSKAADAEDLLVSNTKEADCFERLVNKPSSHEDTSDDAFLSLSRFRILSALSNQHRRHRDAWHPGFLDHPPQVRYTRNSIAQGDSKALIVADNHQATTPGAGNRWRDP